jgi:hypothetical protein
LGTGLTQFDQVKAAGRLSYELMQGMASDDDLTIVNIPSSDSVATTTGYEQEILWRSTL